MKISRGFLLQLLLFGLGLLATALIAIKQSIFSWILFAISLLIIATVVFLRFPPTRTISRLIIFIGIICVLALSYPNLVGPVKNLKSFKDCPDCPELIAVTPGRFTMGSLDSERGRYQNEGPAHLVTIAHSFAAGKFPVTVDQFKYFVNETNYDASSNCVAVYVPIARIRSGASWKTPGFAQTGLHPATCINWHDAEAYVQWLSRKSGQQYRLLSEAEREYITRAGSTTPYWWGSTISRAQANYNDSGDGSRPPPGTVPVNTFQANPWGFYQVHGNIFEWVEDCWHADYTGAPEDGLPWADGDCEYHVVRGGGWVTAESGLRSALRGHDKASYRANYIGFRVAKPSP